MPVMTNADLNRAMAETSVAEKSSKPTIVEVKNGKLVFKQKPLSYEKMSETMQEIVNFREMLEDRIETKAPALTALPDEYRPLIAKLVHESDKGIQALSKHIQQELLPVQDEDEEDSRQEVIQVFPLDTIERAIKSSATRQNYGLDSSAVGGKVPASWQVWRWEVKDEFRCWLPKGVQEKAQTRYLERQQAKEDVLNLFQALPESERHNIVGTKSAGKAHVHGQDKNELVITHYTPVANDASSVVEAQGELLAPKVDIGDQEARQAEGEPSHAKKGRPKKPVDPERVAKEKEREAKKLAKVEREKKEQEARNKSRNLFASFFNKPKASASAEGSGHGSRQGSIPQDNEAGPSSPSKKQSDFARTFRPFSLKKGAELAPVNWFRETRRYRGKRTLSGHHLEGDVIVIDDDEDIKHNEDTDEQDDVQMSDVTVQENPHLGQMTAEERLRDALSSMPHTHMTQPTRRRLRTDFKSYHPYSVRTIVTQLNEAEISGDDEAVRSLLALLQDREKVPAKVLIFAEDARPGYYGTWTRNSREVGPRTPFARDVVAIDYSYDSGEEWEEEQGDADNVDDDDEDEGAATEEVDSDLDSWLVDDDEVEPGTPIEDRASSPDFFDFDLPPAPSKRKRDPEVKATKKRKVVVPLVAFTKGPCWESVIGRCEYEPFSAYRIELFNDTPLPINPFSFVSTPVEEKSATSKSQTYHIPPAGNTDFLVPDLPPHVTAALKMNGHLAVPVPGSSSSPSTASKRAVLPSPKTTFPEQYLPFLLAKITELATGSLTFLIEAIYKDLSEFKVKKNAIEAKVREVSEKSKEGKRVWVVRSEFKVAHGLA